MRAISTGVGAGGAGAGAGGAEPGMVCTVGGVAVAALTVDLILASTVSLASLRRLILALRAASSC